jgi:hypothetical protein
LNFGTFEIRATKEHPFYVKGKGWVKTEDLQIGDVCRSASDTEIVLIAKDFELELVSVYNFEVENSHAYFVGENNTKNVLVHNSCWENLEYASGIAWGGIKGAGQGVLNTVNGLQDMVVSVLNIPATAINGIAYVEEKTGILNSEDSIYVPYIPSPDWSRNLITEEYGEAGSWSDTHGWSKFIGSDAAATLATIGASKVISLGKDIDEALKFDELGELGYTLDDLANIGSKVKTNFSQSSIQHVYSRHGKDFGMTENANKANLEKLAQILDDHINNPYVSEIQGTYRGKPVTHFYDYKTQIDVMVNPDGTLAGAWKLGKPQIKNLLEFGGNVQ